MIIIKLYYMTDTFKFPNGGFDVKVCRRKDIIECIDENIIDKDIALAIIDKCEFDAANYLRQGRWTGIPFIGNIRIPKSKLLEQSPEQQALIQEAKERLEPEKYVMFRKQLCGENIKQVKHERYYKYITSIAVNRNRKLYKKLCKTKGEVFARLYFYSCKEVVSVDNEYINIEDYE